MTATRETVGRIELAEIREARMRIAQTIVRTPLVRLELGPGFPEIRLTLETAAPAARAFAMGSAQVFPDWKASFVDGADGHSVFPRMWERMNR